MARLPSPQLRPTPTPWAQHARTRPTRLALPGPNATRFPPAVLSRVTPSRAKTRAATRRVVVTSNATGRPGPLVATSGTAATTRTSAAPIAVLPGRTNALSREVPATTTRTATATATDAGVATVGAAIATVTAVAAVALPDVTGSTR